VAKRGYKTNSKAAPYGMTKAGVPRKRPGRRKGVEKTPGSGRSKTPIEEQLDTASDELALAVISGTPIEQYGATGKAYTAPAALSLRQKFAEVWWNRRRPTLVASQIKAEVKTEVLHQDPPEPRDVARAVLSILEHAKLADEAVAEPTQPGQLLIGRDRVIELSVSDELVSVTAPALKDEVPGGMGRHESEASSPTNGSTSTTADPSSRTAASVPSGGASMAAAPPLPDTHTDYAAHVGRPDQRAFGPKPPTVLRRRPR